MIALQQEVFFEEILDFLVSTPTPQQILDFRPSEAMQQRVSELLETNRQGRLTAEENAELDRFVELEHFMQMLKIKARLKLA